MQQALADARQYAAEYEEAGAEFDKADGEPVSPGWTRTVLIGRCNDADPVYYAGEAVDVDFMLEAMETCYGDNEGPYANGEIFETREGAAAALREALKTWANEYVKSRYWCSANEVEVEISDADDVLDAEKYSATDVDAELRRLGGDPEAIGKRGQAFVDELLGKRKTDA